MYYLKLKFKNAKLFNSLKNNDIKDFTFDIYGNKKSREKNLILGNSIHMNHVSNMIHVLFGERPVPSLRDSVYVKNDSLYDLASRSYIKIDNYKTINQKNKTEHFITEKTSMKKSVYNSYRPNVQVSWDIIESYFDIHFNDFIIFLEKLTNISDIRTKYSANDLISILENQKESIEKFTRPIKKSGFNYLLSTEIGKCSELTKNINSLLTVNNGVNDCAKLFGDIIIPLTENELEQFRTVSSGTANILDGGMVYIDEVVSEYEFNQDILNSYTPVSNL